MNFKFYNHTLDQRFPMASLLGIVSVYTDGCIPSAFPFIEIVSYSMQICSEPVGTQPLTLGHRYLRDINDPVCNVKDSFEIVT